MIDPSRSAKKRFSHEIVILICISIASLPSSWILQPAQATPTASVTDFGPGSPLYFTSVGGYPAPATFSGLPALKLLPPSQNYSYAGAAWNALKFSGQPVGFSINGGYTQANGVGLADGFTIILFARNGTIGSQQVNYANFSIPLFNACSGICGHLVLPSSVSQYVALQWDPFYGTGAQFNLWVINSTSVINANSQRIGCGIGTPRPGDVISFNTTYVPNGNILQASIADPSLTASCSFSTSLTQFRFNNPLPGNYWAIVEGDTGGGTADWTLTQAKTIGSQVSPFVGRVCLVPGDSLACPQTIADMALDPTGHLDVSVNILGSPRFNAFGISLHWDPLVANATAADLTNTTLQSPSISTKCLNGGGMNCGTHDGVGVGHLDVVSNTTLTAPASGRLFKLSLVGLPLTDPHVGFARGCTSVGFAPGFAGPGSVPNTDSCVFIGVVSTTICGTLCITAFTTAPESLQSQKIGTKLPTTLSSATPAGNITIIKSGGLAPNYDDTWIMPHPVTLFGNITGWKAQFTGGVLSSSIPFPSTPAFIQIKVLRPTSTNILTVVETGPVHAPGSVLQTRLVSYPFVRTEWTTIPYYTDTLLTVQPGDYIGITISSNRTLGAWYNYPFVNSTTGTRYVSSNVTLGGTINLADPSTFTLSGLAPALDVNIQPTPPRVDTSGDGIPDFVALSPEMQALSVDPCRKNVLVQLDYMVSADGRYTFKPLPDALSTVTNAFDSAPVQAVPSCPYQGFPKKPTGVNLVLDVRNQIPTQDVISFLHSEPLSFDEVKATFLDTNRVQYFHYGLFVNHTLPGSTQSGAGEVYGSNFMVSLGGWHNQVGNVNEQAGSLMHELGHNLGLEHGGNQSVNYKPNYLSVMSYEHQVVGIATSTPTGDVIRFDYSREALPSLQENSLSGWLKLSTSNDYTKWVCPDHHTTMIGLVSNYVDWNCNGILQTGIVSDINNDTTIGTLTGYNDWANLQYDFVQSDNFNVGCLAHCDIGCLAHCDIGCLAHCDIGNHLDFPTAQRIEATWSAFLASPHHQTTTNLSCSPSSVIVNTPTTCTASVTDPNTAPITPIGNVSFQSSQPGTFAPSTCGLVGTGATTSCSVTYTPSLSSLGPQTISTGYTGDSNHLGSSSFTSVSGQPLPTFTVTTNTTLTNDIVGRITIAADNLTLNCNGHTIRGVTTDQVAGTYPGILLTGRRGVIIENCRVTDFYVGIQVSSSTANLLLRDSSNGNGYGFILSSSTFNALVVDNATNDLHDGFRLESSMANAVARDRAGNNQGSGFILVGSSRNILAFNTANSNNAYGFALTLFSQNNQVLINRACANGIFDAFQDPTSTANVYANNSFCTTSGLPKPRD